MTSVAVLALPLSAKADGSKSPWTGFYVGGSLGTAFSSTSADYSGPQYYDTGYRTGAMDLGKARAALGVQAGYNKQFDHVVAGVEVSYISLFGNKASGFGAWPDCEGCAAHVTTGATGLFALKGKLGFEIKPGTLVYGTAGAGWLKVDDNMDVTDVFGVGKGGNFASKSWKPSFVYGAGLEQALDAHWSLRGEVVWVKPQSFTAGPKDLSYFSDTTPGVKYKDDLTLGTVSLNYRF